MINYPARLIPVPLNKIEEYLPEGDALRVRRVYSGEMQPDSYSTWSREFLIARIKLRGAYLSGPLRGSDSDATTIGIPETDGGMIFVIQPVKKADEGGRLTLKEGAGKDAQCPPGEMPPKSGIASSSHGQTKRDAIFSDTLKRVEPAGPSK